jgi:hypothetical protein
MAVPAQPTATSIVTEGLKRGGRVAPTALQITSALNEALQEVKADIMLVAPTHNNLMVTATSVTTKGLQRYALPPDSNEQANIVLLDGPDEWRGTAQASGSNTLTLEASLSASEADIVGKYLLITSGPGVEEFHEIIAYDEGTKVATIDVNWQAMPTVVGSYLIVNTYMSLWPLDTVTEFDNILNPTTLGVPRQAAVFQNEFSLYPVPDKSTYGLMNRYWADISLLDETGDTFLQLLREWRSLFIQGIAVKTDQRYDEDRYQLELSIYNGMLSSLSTQTSRVQQIRFKDL